MNINEETLLGLIFYSLDNYNLTISIDDINEYILILTDKLKNYKIKTLNIKFPNINKHVITDHWRNDYDVMNDTIKINPLVINEKRDVIIIDRAYQIFIYELLRNRINEINKVINGTKLEFKEYYQNKKIKKKNF